MSPKVPYSSSSSPTFININHGLLFTGRHDTARRLHRIDHTHEVTVDRKHAISTVTEVTETRVPDRLVGVTRLNHTDSNRRRQVNTAVLLWTVSSPTSSRWTDAERQVSPGRLWKICSLGSTPSGSTGEAAEHHHTWTYVGVAVYCLSISIWDRGTYKGIETSDGN